MAGIDRNLFIMFKNLQKWLKIGENGDAKKYDNYQDNGDNEDKESVEMATCQF